MFRRIMVPLDGSPLAESSLSCAEEMAGRMGSQVVLLSVLETGASQYANLFRCYLESRANALKSKVADCGGPDVEVVPLLVDEEEEEDLVAEEPPGKDIGHPAADIIAAAADQGVSLIVMATHGYSGFRRLALSSVADAIVRGSGLPVLLVRPHQGDTLLKSRICRNIVVPLDGSAMAETAVRVVEEMAEKLTGQEMTVGLIHVAPERRVATTDQPSPAFLTAVEDPTWCKSGDRTDEYLKQAESYLRHCSAGLEQAGVTVNYTVRTGKPEDEITGYTAEQGAAMVVMACHARTGIGRYLIGSTTDRILRTIEASVLLLRPGKPVPSEME